MAVRGKGFQKKHKASGEIPSSSLADIAFLLLIFFMVSTTFRSEDPRQVTMPEAAAALDISLATAERYWTFAKSWLYAELADDV